MQTLIEDARYGLRMLRKSPSFTIVAVITLALGIGANTALFSIVNGVLLNPLPFHHPDQLIALSESKANFNQGSISYPNFLDWKKGNHTFSAMAIARSFGFSLTGVSEAEQVNAEFISSDFFPLLGIKPVLGRTFASGEDSVGAGPVVLISEGFWHRKLSTAPDVLGKSLTLNGKDYTIIGVIPASFHLVAPSFKDSELYVPIGQWNNNLLLNRGAGLGIHGFGRLKPGVTIEQARADMATVTGNLAAAYPGEDKGIGASLLPLKERMVGNARPRLLVLLAAVGFVLLIACVNVASLMLARSTSRMREFAIRAALGATRARVVRQLLTESVLLAVGGGAVGLLLASWATSATLRLLPTAVPRAEEIGLDARVLIFTMAISLLAGILFGLAPAFKTSRPDLHDTLKEGGRGASGTRHRAQSVFVVMEMAMALVLLVGAGLMIRSLIRLWQVDPGFDSRNVLTFSLALPPSMTTATPDAIRSNVRAIDDKLASVPGVRAISLTWGAFPLSSDDEQQFWLEDQPKPASENEMSWTLDYIVGPGYLQAMGIPLDHGRFFTSQDNQHSPLVIVIDDAFARKVFPGQDPVGKRIHINGYNTPAQIVGVVRHVKQWSLDSSDRQELQSQMYLSFMQLADDTMALVPAGISFVVRSSGEAPGLLDSIRHSSQQMSREQVIYDPQTMNEIVSASLSSHRFSMILLGVFAVLALVLASIGIYGVISYVVGQRTHEIGIRTALGAQRQHILRLILGRGGMLALAGVGLGIVAALGLTRLMAGLLYGVRPTDPLTFGGVAMLLLMVALVACYIPARRATKVDPMVALRCE